MNPVAAVKAWMYFRKFKYVAHDLASHSRAGPIKNHLRHLEHYLAHVGDLKLSTGRREQMQDEIDIHSTKLKRCGIEPPTDSIQAAKMMDEFSWQHYT